MQGWIVVGVWAFAVVFAAVLLVFCLYEISWKVRRLQSDKLRLDRLVAELSGVGTALAETAERARGLNRTAPAVLESQAG
ncbi:hypothetical protein M6D93_10080 [Jatrophihabitans telluris]|uniref:DUF948 domain-containing protein n=1 Tax=Jatrophihabitans telluris TaxID=2038343 RepID=A0ABY4QS43_9ACTN|nr:hypothetical protein [Jatrophihabitans telluris]UQX86660.1 hypothetical protein M6D93_10080 [Jatrophihabitans telluris]